MVDAADDAKARTTRAFTMMADSYDQGGPSYFARFGRSLVELAGIERGARVLDVATGRGAALFPAAEAAGDAGSVIGVDLTEAMVAALSAEIEARAVSNAEARQMDAEDLEFPNAAFDVVLCGFGLMFFPRLDRALGEFRRVLKPGGTLAVSTFATVPLTPAVAPVMRRWQEQSRNPLSQDLATPGELRAALQRGGFVDVTVLEETLEVVYPDAEAYWSWLMSLLVGPWFRAQPPETQAGFRADVFARLEQTRQADGIHEAITALFGIARP
jgi:ubiquinone/menaquinone biosynthesis C-methylase UbiE